MSEAKRNIGTYNWRWRFEWFLKLIKTYSLLYACCPLTRWDSAAYCLPRSSKCATLAGGCFSSMSDTLMFIWTDVFITLTCWGSVAHQVTWLVSSAVKSPSLTRVMIFLWTKLFCNYKWTWNMLINFRLYYVHNYNSNSNSISFIFTYKHTTWC